MSDAMDDVGAFGYKQELKRSLRLADLVAYGLVFIVPIAPVAVFGIVFNASHGMVPLVYSLGLGAMLFTALSYMAMSRAFPVAGSVYTYATRSLGRFVGFFAGWAMLLDYLLLPTLTYIGCAIAVHSALPAIPKTVSVLTAVAIATGVNYLGIETTARASFMLLIFQLTLLIIFGICALLALSRHVGGAHLSFLPFYNPAEITTELVFGALSLAVLSFLGFDAISTLSEESIGGSAAVSQATMLSLCLAATLFLAQTWLASLFVLGRSSLPPGDATEAAFYDVAALVGGYWLKFLLAVPGVVFAGVAGAVTAQASTARLVYGMARDGQLPRALAHVDARRRIPIRATFLVSGITLILALLTVDSLELLVGTVSFGALMGFLLLHSSVIAHFIVRQRSRNWLRHLIVPGIGLLLVGYVLLNAPGRAKLAGAAWMVVGGGLLVTLKQFQRKPSAVAEAYVSHDMSPGGKHPDGHG